MALRLIEMVLPEARWEETQELVKERSTLGIWHVRFAENQMLVKVLLPAEETEAVLDAFEKRFSLTDGFRIILLPVEASIPRPDLAEEPDVQEQEPEPEPDAKTKLPRISREELYADISDLTSLSYVYVVMVVLSSIVAAIGIQRNNVAIIIGAMVIAPLLGPNVGLSLATTLGDMALAARALKAGVVGILTALVISLGLGFAITVNPDTPEIASRTTVTLGDIALALASGSAGALALTTGLSTTLIGVMVAVALLPPLVTVGLLLGSGYGILAWGAMLLLLTNLICVNLAGVATFLAQGVRPLFWWETNKAKKASRIAIALWTALLVALVALILLSQKG